MNKATIILLASVMLGCGAAAGDEDKRARSPGNMTGEQVSVPLPADFPDDLYLPPDILVQAVYDGGVSYQLHGRMAGPKADIRTAYDQAMTELGWVREADNAQAQLQSAVRFSKADRLASVSLIEHKSGDVVVRIDIYK